jgi:anti-sigma factor RsiW
MSCPEYESRLHDHADGRLSATERQEVDRHVAGCAACRQVLDELERLLRRVRALPRDLAPRRDLLPAVRAALASGTASPASAGWTRWAGVAAGLLLGALLVVGGARWGADPTVPAEVEDLEGAGVQPAATDGIAALRAAEDEYSRALQQLMASFEERRDELSPEAADALTRNLAIIDRAIDDIRTALEADPENPANSQLLATMQRQKVELLWRVLRLSS